RVDYGPPTSLTHPKLGLLKYSEGMWEGKAPFVGGLEFTLIGKREGPDQSQVEQVLLRLENFSALEQEIRDFLRNMLTSVPGAKAHDFQIRALNFLGYFSVDLKLPGDEYGIWRIEFVDGRPKFWSRDD